MSKGHHDTHGEAGPNGITLNDLHVSSPRKTTEMFSIKGAVSDKSPLAKEAGSPFRGLNLRSLLGLSLFYVSAFVISHSLVASFLGNDVAAYLAMFTPQHATATPIALAFLAIIGQSLGLWVLSATGGLKLLLDSFPLELPEAFSDDKSFAKRIKPKTNMITFGHLQVSYHVTDKALVVRSLADRLVAVFSGSMIESAEIGDEEDYAPWRGNEKTPPAVVTLETVGGFETSGYKSKLIIHGMYFETPGLKAADTRKKVEEFIKQIAKIKME